VRSKVADTSLIGERESDTARVCLTHIIVRIPLLQRRNHRSLIESRQLNQIFRSCTTTTTTARCCCSFCGCHRSFNLDVRTPTCRKWEDCNRVEVQPDSNRESWDEACRVTRDDNGHTSRDSKGTQWTSGNETKLTFLQRW
jgi:hypothetical protein